MSAASYIQASLAGGEIGPGLYGRVDLALYQNALKRCLNFITQPHGGAKNRPGFRFVAELKDSAKTVRLVPFVFNAEQSYVLELGEQYLRVFKNGGQLHIATPAAWATATAYPVGQHVSIGGVNYTCLVLHTSGTFATDLAAGKWYALTGSIVEIPTPWFEGDLPLLRFVQSADVLTLTHPDYGPGQITRTSETSWTYADFIAEFGPFQELNEDQSLLVTASAVSGSITITSNLALFSASSIGKLFYVGQKDYGQAWESGKSISAAGTIRRAGGDYYAASAGAYPAFTGTSMPQNLQDAWNDGGVIWSFLHPGFGIARITSVTDATHAVATVLSRIPDAVVSAWTYKWAFGAWNESDGYPGAVTYHQQRQFFAGSPKLPQTVWGSQVGDYTHFGMTTPILDSDAVTYPLAGRQVNQVKHLVGLGWALLALTSDSYWTLVGDATGNALTPSSVQANVQSYMGAADVEPVTIGNECLFVGDKGQTVRNVGYSMEQGGYVGKDLTMMAPHLFEGHQIVDMAYQQHPFGVVWCVREDGVLLGLTYAKDQQVAAWHQHETDGFFESVCVVPEQGEDVLYAVVRRLINGATRRFLERMDRRFFTDDREFFFLDSGLSFHGANMDGTTLTVSGGTSWDENDAVTIDASAPVFAYPAQTDQSDALLFTTAAGKRLSFTILSTSSTTQALAVPGRIVPEEYRETARADWAWGRKDFAGIGHLEGKTVAVLADGHVHPSVVVTDGMISLQSPATVVHAGLPYSGSLISLDLAIFGGETIRDKKKLVTAVRAQVESTRGLKAGIPGGQLTEMKQRGSEDYSKPVTPKTGLMSIRIAGTWNDSGGIEIRQDYPLPAHVLSLMPEVSTGGTV